MPELQTREEDYNEAKAKYDEVVANNRGIPKSEWKPLPLVPEIINETTVTHRDAQGRKIMADEKDYNGTDVRLIDHETGLATGWRKAAEKSELENDWAELG